MAKKPGSAPASGGSRFPAPDAKIHLDSELRAALEAFERKYQIDMEVRMEQLQEALEDVKLGALPHTAILARTGIPIGAWTTMTNTVSQKVFEKAHRQYQVKKEQDLGKCFPLAWLRGADKETWQETSKTEQIGTIDLNVKKETDEAAVLAAAKAIERRSKEKKS